MVEPEKSIPTTTTYLIQIEPPHRQYLRRQNSGQTLGTRLRIARSWSADPDDCLMDPDPRT